MSDINNNDLGDDDPKAPTRADYHVLGKIIGSASGWDQPDSFDITLYELDLNDLGRRFLPEVTERLASLTIGFETGEVFNIADDDTETRYQPIWSAFDSDDETETEED